MGKSALCRENPSRQYYDFSCYTLHRIITSKGITSIQKLELCDNHKGDIFWHQKAFLQPAVSYIWEKEQETLINQLTDKKEVLVLGGDGRAGQTVQDTVQSTDHIQLLISNRARLWI